MSDLVHSNREVRNESREFKACISGLIPIIVLAVCVTVACNFLIVVIAVGKIERSVDNSAGTCKNGIVSNGRNLTARLQKIESGIVQTLSAVNELKIRLGDLEKARHQDEKTRQSIEVKLETLERNIDQMLVKDMVGADPHAVVEHERVRRNSSLDLGGSIKIEREDSNGGFLVVEPKKHQKRFVRSTGVVNEFWQRYSPRGPEVFIGPYYRAAIALGKPIYVISNDTTWMVGFPSCGLVCDGNHSFFMEEMSSMYGQVPVDRSCLISENWEQQILQIEKEHGSRLRLPMHMLCKTSQKVKERPIIFLSYNADVIGITLPNGTTVLQQWFFESCAVLGNCGIFLEYTIAKNLDF